MACLFPLRLCLLSHQPLIIRVKSVFVRELLFNRFISITCKAPSSSSSALARHSGFRNDRPDSPCACTRSEQNEDGIRVMCLKTIHADRVKSKLVIVVKLAVFINI